MTLTEFLLARIAEDYERERGTAAAYSAVEMGARVRANLRRIGIGALSMATGRPVSAAKVEAAKYAGHQDFDPAWQL